MPPTQHQQEIEETFQNLKRAIQERKYREVQPILDRQRELLNGLDFRDPMELDLLKQAQNITQWALTLARAQHAHDERAYASMLRLKQADAGYMPPRVASAASVQFEG